MQDNPKIIIAKGISIINVNSVDVAQFCVTLFNVLHTTAVLLGVCFSDHVIKLLKNINER